ncbi:pyridoxal phosphate-dependent aminotransferase [Halogranum rubrum]|uniref:Aminotransferase n=1 Tax=Halogranum salarium B-1 TaxID=1210908 RepID=J3EZJ0_9EURY|nr:pyridoxal phosphate-dependent aminotransferase [Halogranum salarium]EJN61027.1 aspartate/tyrosine/aromatic aminotransferase [Halogranum salarium B-1]
MFSPMPYLEWIEGRPEEANYDLGSSDLRRKTPTADVVPEQLVDLPSPTDETTLRAQIAATYDVEEAEVLVTAGATHANFLTAATVLGLGETDEGEEQPEQQILVEKPGYQPLVATPEAVGARVDRFLRLAEDDYALDPSRVANAASDNLSLVTVTNRHNPTGRLIDRKSLAAVARAAADAGGYLLVDEVYAPYVETATNGQAFGGVTAAGLPNTIVTGSLTKFHGLGGLRIGWLIGPESFVRRAKATTMHVPAVAQPSRALARRALHNDETLVADSRSLLRENHERLATFVEDRTDLSGAVYEGSSFALLSHDTADGDTVAERAWEEGVLVVPGRFFDQGESFRLSLGRSPEEIDEGLSVLGDVLASL